MRSARRQRFCPRFAELRAAKSSFQVYVKTPHVKSTLLAVQLLPATFFNQIAMKANAADAERERAELLAPSLAEQIRRELKLDCVNRVSKRRVWFLSLF